MGGEAGKLRRFVRHLRNFVLQRRPDPVSAGVDPDLVASVAAAPGVLHTLELNESWFDNS